jgi:hypothetical protein
MKNTPAVSNIINRLCFYIYTPTDQSKSKIKVLLFKVFAINKVIKNSHSLSGNIHMLQSCYNILYSVCTELDMQIYNCIYLIFSNAKRYTYIKNLNSIVFMATS